MEPVTILGRVQERVQEREREIQRVAFNRERKASSVQENRSSVQEKESVRRSEYGRSKTLKSARAFESSRVRECTIVPA
jgi:hypothetical protein